jgi:hypothetical protein
MKQNDVEEALWEFRIGKLGLTISASLISLRTFRVSRIFSVWRKAFGSVLVLK